MPFGSFEGCLQTEDTTPLDPDVLEHKYYARGIGPVLAVDVAGGGRVTVVLPTTMPSILRFAMESGRDQTLFIIRYESTLEFSVPSMAAFESEENMPHFLSTLLMKRSSEKKIGFWCIERIGDKSVYSYMHNAEMQLIDSDYFAKVVRALITECDDFEGVLIQLLSK